MGVAAEASTPCTGLTTGIALFASTASFKTFVAAVNAAPTDRMVLIFQRILGALSDKAVDPFSNEEKEKLCGMLSCSTADINTMIEGASYVYERAAYNGV